MAPAPPLPRRLALLLQTRIRIRMRMRAQADPLPLSLPLSRAQPQVWCAHPLCPPSQLVTLHRPHIHSLSLSLSLSLRRISASAVPASRPAWQLWQLLIDPLDASAVAMSPRSRCGQQLLPLPQPPLQSKRKRTRCSRRLCPHRWVLGLDYRALVQHQGRDRDRGSDSVSAASLSDQLVQVQAAASAGASPTVRFHLVAQVRLGMLLQFPSLCLRLPPLVAQGIKLTRVARQRAQLRLRHLHLRLAAQIVILTVVTDDSPAELQQAAHLLPVVLLQLALQLRLLLSLSVWQAMTTSGS